MAISTSELPSKCCGFSLRTSSMVIGSFALVTGITFLGLTAAGDSALNEKFCSHTLIKGSGQNICIEMSETHKMVVNLLTILAILNAAEVVMSIGLIWGANKRILAWITRWLIVTTVWVLLHCTVAIIYVFAATEGWAITITAVLGIFFFGVVLFSMLIVLSFRNELLHSHFCYSAIDPFHQASAPAQDSGNTGRIQVEPAGACDGAIPKILTS